MTIRVAFRMFYLGESGGLRGLGFEAGRPSWTAGVNDAFCAVDVDHQAPHPSCACGFTVSDSLGAAATFAAWNRVALVEALDLHVDHFGSSPPGDRSETIDRGVLAQVSVRGRRAAASTEDEQDLFYRVESARVRKVWLPANLAGFQLDLEDEYQASVYLDEHRTGDAFFRSFLRDGDPLPEDLGCGMCPRPRPGPEHYPVCETCRNRVRAGAMNAYAELNAAL